MNPDLEGLSGLDRDQLRAALSRALDAGAVAERDWRALVELYTGRIAAGPDRDGEELSAELALYERLLNEAEQAGALSALESTTRRLNLASALLEQVAARHDGGLLDPDRIVELLLGALPVSLETAAATGDWRRLERADIVRLRTAKNLLQPALAALRAASGDTLDERVKAWEPVLARLP